MVLSEVHDEKLDRPSLERLQRRKLTAMLDEVLERNPFYRAKLGGVSFDAEADPIERLPLTTRDEIQKDQQAHPPYGTNLTYPLDRYTRLHQTSGSAGSPIRWLDTDDSWQWWRRCWATIYDAAGVGPADRIAFTFSFGPFVGFWSAFDGALALGNFVLPCGGMTTAARIRAIVEHGITFVCCTPTYALRMAEVAETEGVNLSGASVRGLIVAGEPGGNIATTRSRIESAWGARVYDHAGMTEIGPWGFEDAECPEALCVIESEFIAEVIDPATGNNVPEGEPGELVLTNLGRWGSPLIRYRTGDQVLLRRDRTIGGRSFAYAEGGVLGRIDDMLFIRGNNVFPSAVEGIIREFEEVAEFRLTVERRNGLTDLRIEVEHCPEADCGTLARRIETAVRDRLHFRPSVELVEPGTLPRFEMKAKRVAKKV